jgi:hypothetical protein
MTNLRVKFTQVIYKPLVALAFMTFHSYEQVTFKCPNTNWHRAIYNVNIQGSGKTSEEFSAAVRHLTCDLAQFLQG